MNALRQHFSLKNLEFCWRGMRSKFSNTTTPGVDGMTVKKFKAEIDEQLLNISKLVKAGKYQFSELKPIAISKSDGGIRLINVPTIRDRFVQRMILEFFKSTYSDKWKISSSFSSLGKIDNGPSEGTHETLRLIKQQVQISDYLIKADLSKFFDTIDRKEMKKFIRKNVRHRSFHPLIFAAVECETSESKGYYRSVFQNSGLIRGAGVRQGMPISPVLAYLYLSDVDRKLGENVFRYVDDLLFINSNKKKLLSNFKTYKTAVEKRGLKIHGLDEEGSKTVSINPASSFEFLGIKVVRKEDGNVFQIPSKSKTKIMAKLDEISTYPKAERKKQKGWALSAISRVSGLERDYGTAYSSCEDWPKFRNELKQKQLSMCRKIATEIFDLKKGDKEHLLRAFGVKG